MKLVMMLIAVVAISSLAGGIIAPDGLVLYTPNDWHAAQRTSGLTVGAMVGGALAVFLCVAWLGWHIVRKACKRGRK